MVSNSHKNLEASEEQISESRRIYQNPYAHVMGDGSYAAVLSDSATDKGFDIIDLASVRDHKALGTKYSSYDIELIAKSLQLEMWQKRDKLFDSTARTDPLDLLNPVVALKTIGYTVNSSTGIGQFHNGERTVEVAGYIDSSTKVVGISNKLPFHVKSFTTAHELGHAVLHNAVGMHRDRAVDGGKVSGKRRREEIEADKFATYFLMPEKQIRKEFRARFGTEAFVINDDSAFFLSNSSREKFKLEIKSLRQLARLLAKAERYGCAITSMQSRFRVSTEAMAIRLEELNLLKLQN